MMHMTFYWGRKVTLLFDFWKTQDWIDYALTLAACLIFSVFYQYMERQRIRFKRLSSSSSLNKSPAAEAADTPLLSPKLNGGGFRWNWANFAGALLFGVNSAIGYLLMLAIMSFNGGVFVAVVVGLAVGYLLFRCADDDVLLVVDNPCACA